MKKPKIAIVIGSNSDLKIMEKAFPILDNFGVSYDLEIASAHRVPKKVINFAKNAEKNYDLIIAGAGMSAHLPGVIASYTTIPIIGVPISGSALSGFDSLYSIVQMPPGVPVASVAIDGAKNAAILCAQILSLKYPKLRSKLKKLKLDLSKGRKI